MNLKSFGKVWFFFYFVFAHCQTDQTNALDGFASQKSQLGSGRIYK